MGDGGGSTPLFLSFQGWQFFFLFVVMFHEICEKMNKQNWMSYITTLLYTVWQQYKHNLGIVWGLLTNTEISLGSEFVIFSQNKYIFYWPRTKLVYKKDSKDAGSSKYSTTRKNTQRYHIPKRLISYSLSNRFFFLLSMCSFLIKREKQSG